MTAAFWDSVDAISTEFAERAVLAHVVHWTLLGPIEWAWWASGRCREPRL